MSGAFDTLSVLVHFPSSSEITNAKSESVIRHSRQKLVASLSGFAKNDRSFFFWGVIIESSNCIWLVCFVNNRVRVRKCQVYRTTGRRTLSIIP
jgi:hypothetical protein